MTERRSRRFGGWESRGQKTGGKDVSSRLTASKPQFINLSRDEAQGWDARPKPGPAQGADRVPGGAAFSLLAVRSRGLMLTSGPGFHSQTRRNQVFLVILVLLLSLHM